MKIEDPLIERIVGDGIDREIAARGGFGLGQRRIRRHRETAMTGSGF
jgi:hypothetical protein